MLGLTVRQEAALALLWLNQEKIPCDYTDVGITPELLQLRESGLIDLTTDWGHELLVKAITPAGRMHYDEARRARRKFRMVSDSADELMLKLVAGDTAKPGDGGMRMATIYDNRDNDYSELSRNGLLRVSYADDRPWFATVTDDGRSYSEGWFLDQMESGVNVVFNNNNTVTSSADASMNVSDVTLGTTVAAILDLDIDQSAKDEAEAAAKELDAASREKDKTRFAEKLEKAARVAKSSASLAGVLLPLIQAAVGTLLG